MPMVLRGSRASLASRCCFRLHLHVAMGSNDVALQLYPGGRDILHIRQDTGICTQVSQEDADSSHDEHHRMDKVMVEAGSTETGNQGARLVVDKIQENAGRSLSSFVFFFLQTNA